MKRMVLIAPAILILLSGASGQPKWLLAQKSDPITDIQSATLTLAQDPNVLQVSCDKGSAERYSVVVGTTQNYLGGYPVSRKGIVRFDAAVPEQVLWGYSGNFAVLSHQHREFISSLGRASKVAVRLADRDGSPVDLVFDTTGSEIHVGKFFAACKALGID